MSAVTFFFFTMLSSAHAYSVETLLRSWPSRFITLQLLSSASLARQSATASLPTFAKRAKVGHPPTLLLSLRTAQSATATAVRRMSARA